MRIWIWPTSTRLLSPTTLLRSSAAKTELIFSLAAELLGGARACLDRTVEYLLVREQFGRVIGSFQAAAHVASSRCRSSRRGQCDLARRDRR
jgi:hypothetical protein